jgi:hypothetical protein
MVIVWTEPLKNSVAWRVITEMSHLLSNPISSVAYLPDGKYVLTAI